MRKASVYQTKNNLNSKEIEKELDVLDYVFEIAGKDITKVRVAYFFDKIEKVTYQDGKRRLEQEPLVVFVNVNIKMHKKGKISVYKKGNKICPISVYSLQTSLWFKTSLVR